MERPSSLNLTGSHANVERSRYRLGANRVGRVKALATCSKHVSVQTNPTYIWICVPSLSWQNVRFLRPKKRQEKTGLRTDPHGIRCVVKIHRGRTVPRPGMPAHSSGQRLLPVLALPARIIRAVGLDLLANVREQLLFWGEQSEAEQVGP
jgi:hypothetical protein